MTAKTFLSQAQRVGLKLESMNSQMRSLRDAAENITQALSDMPRSPTRNISKTEDIMVRVLDLERDMNNLFDKLADIHRVINAVDDPLRKAALVKRYIDGDVWKSISVDLGISVRRVHQIHEAALAEVELLMADYTQLHTIA